MGDENDHKACVEAWMARGAKALPPERMIQAFEQGFGALWRRAHQTLGDVTLTAIVDRVLHNATQRYPILAAFRLEPTGLQWQGARDGVPNTQRDDVENGVRFILVEFLTVLGNLTANILTSSLHAELCKIVPEARGTDVKKSPDQRRYAARKSENAKS
jgi:hypothetical protein